MIILDLRYRTILEGEKFLDNLCENIYILGTNKYGSVTCRWLLSQGKNVKGFINDYTSEVVFEGLPIFKSDSVEKKSAIVNSIVEGRCISARNNIYKLEPSRVVTYFSLQKAYDNVLPEIDFLTETDDIIEDLDKYRIIYSLLSDSTSRKQYLDILNFRFNRSIQFLDSFKFNIHEQYFEEFVKINSSPIFIDGGSFDGLTSLMFSEKYPDYNRIYIFEPNRSSMVESKRKLKSKSNVIFIEMGLWKDSVSVSFDNTLGSASKVSEEGSIFIQTVSIDDFISEKVDFIKLDIEGAEMEALLGAKSTIFKYKPKLAVCVYHNQFDFYKIPNLVLQIRSDYKIYFRHYTEGVFESVMYFV